MKERIELKCAKVLCFTVADHFAVLWIFVIRVKGSFIDTSQIQNYTYNRHTTRDVMSPFVHACIISE